MCGARLLSRHGRAHSTMITEKLLEKMNDKNWQSRKEAMDEVEAMLVTACHRIGRRPSSISAPVLWGAMV